MGGGDAVPAAMFDGDAGFGAQIVEAYLHLGGLIRPERRLAPGQASPGQ